MDRAIKMNFINDDFKMEIELLGNEVENIEDLISDITNKFKEEFKDCEIPFNFIPENAEIDYSEPGFVDIFYLPEYVKYPTTELLEYEKENYPAQDGEDDGIGKVLFEGEMIDEKLILEFKSLVALKEDNTTEYIWDINDGEIKKIFIEFVTDLIKDEEK